MKDFCCNIKIDSNLFIKKGLKHDGKKDEGLNNEKIIKFLENYNFVIFHYTSLANYFYIFYCKHEFGSNFVEDGKVRNILSKKWR